MRKHRSRTHSVGNTIRCCLFITIQCLFFIVAEVAADARVDIANSHNTNNKGNENTQAIFYHADSPKNIHLEVDRKVADMNAIGGAPLKAGEILKNSKGIWMTKDAFESSYANHWHCPKNLLDADQSLQLPVCQNDLQCSLYEKCCNVKSSETKHCLKYTHLLEKNHPLEILDNDNRLLIAIQRKNKVFVHCPKSVQLWKITGSGTFGMSFPPNGLTVKSVAEVNKHQNQYVYTEAQFVNKFGWRWQCPAHELTSFFRLTSRGNSCSRDLDCRNIYHKCCEADADGLRKVCLDVRTLLNSKQTVTVVDEKFTPLVARVVSGMIVVEDPKSPIKLKEIADTEKSQIHSVTGNLPSDLARKYFQQIPGFEAKRNFNGKPKLEDIGLKLKKTTDFVNLLIKALGKSMDGKADDTVNKQHQTSSVPRLQSRSFWNFLKEPRKAPDQTPAKSTFILDSVLPVTDIVSSLPILSALPEDTVKDVLGGLFKTLALSSNGNSSLLGHSGLLGNALSLTRLLPLFGSSGEHNLANIGSDLFKFAKLAVRNLKPKPENSTLHRMKREANDSEPEETIPETSEEKITDPSEPQEDARRKPKKSILSILPIGALLSKMPILNKVPLKVVSDVFSATLKYFGIQESDVIKIISKSKHAPKIVLSAMKLIPVLNTIKKYHDVFWQLVVESYELGDLIMANIGTGTPKTQPHTPSTDTKGSDTTAQEKETEKILKGQQGKDLKEQVSSIMEVHSMHAKESLDKMEKATDMLDLIMALPVFNALPPELASRFLIGFYEQLKKMFLIADDTKIHNQLSVIAKTSVKLVPLARELIDTFHRDAVSVVYHVIGFSKDVFVEINKHKSGRRKREAGEMAMLVSMFPVAAMVKGIPGLEWIPDEGINKIITYIVNALEEIGGDSEHLGEILTTTISLYPVAKEIVKHQISFAHLGLKMLDLGKLMMTKQIQRLQGASRFLTRRRFRLADVPKGEATTVLDDIFPLSQILVSLPILNSLPPDTVVKFSDGLLKALDIGDDSGGPLSKNGLLGDAAKTANQLLPVVENIVNNKTGFFDLFRGILEFLREILLSMKPYVMRAIPPSLIRERRDIKIQEPLFADDAEDVTVDLEIPFEDALLSSDEKHLGKQSKTSGFVDQNFSVISVLMGSDIATKIKAKIDSIKTKSSQATDHDYNETVLADFDLSSMLVDPTSSVNSLVNYLPILKAMPRESIVNLTIKLLNGFNSSFHNDGGFLRKSGPMGNFVTTIKHLTAVLDKLFRKKTVFISFFNQLYDATMNLLNLMVKLKTKVKEAYVGFDGIKEHHKMTLSDFMSDLKNSSKKFKDEPLNNTEHEHLRSSLKGYMLILSTIIRSLPVFNIIPEETLFNTLNDILRLFSFEKLIESAEIFSKNGILEKLLDALDVVKPAIGNLIDVKNSVLALGNDAYDVAREAVDHVHAYGKDVASNPRKRREISLQDNGLNSPFSDSYANIQFSIETTLNAPDIFDIFKPSKNDNITAISTHQSPRRKRSADKDKFPFAGAIKAAVRSLPVLKTLPRDSVDSATTALLALLRSSYKREDGLLRSNGPMGGIIKSFFGMLPLVTTVVSQRQDFFDIVKESTVLADELFEYFIGYVRQVKRWLFGSPPDLSIGLTSRALGPISNIWSSLMDSSLVESVIDPAINVVASLPVKRIVSSLPVRTFGKLLSPLFAVFGVRKEGLAVYNEFITVLKEVQPILDSVKENKGSISKMMKHIIGFSVDITGNIMRMMKDSLLSTKRKKRDVGFQEEPVGMQPLTDGLEKQDKNDSQYGDDYMDEPTTSIPLSSPMPNIGSESRSREVSSESLFRNVLDAIIRFIFGLKDLMLMMFSWMPSADTPLLGAPRVNYFSSSILKKVLQTISVSFSKFVESVKAFPDDDDEKTIDTVIDVPITQILSSLPVFNLIPKETVDGFFMGLFKALKIGEVGKSVLKKNGILRNLISTSKQLMPLFTKMGKHKDRMLSLIYQLLEFMKEIMSNVKLLPNVVASHLRGKRDVKNENAEDSSSSEEMDSSSSSSPSGGLQSRSMGGVALLDEHIPFSDLIKSLPILKDIPVAALDSVINGVSQGLSAVYEKEEGLLRKSGPAGIIAKSVYDLIPVMKSVIEYRETLLEFAGHILDGIRHTLDYAVQLTLNLVAKVTSFKFTPMSLTSRRFKGGTPGETAAMILEDLPRVLSTLPILNTIPEEVVIDFYTGIMKTMGVNEEHGGLLRKGGPVTNILTSVTKLLPILTKVEQHKIHLITMGNHFLQLVKEILTYIKPHMPKFVSKYITRKRRSIDILDIELPLMENLKSLHDSNEKDGNRLGLGVPISDTRKISLLTARENVLRRLLEMNEFERKKLTLITSRVRKRAVETENQESYSEKDPGEYSLDMLLDTYVAPVASFLSSLPILNELPPEIVENTTILTFKAFDSVYQKDNGPLRKSGPMGTIVNAFFQLLPTFEALSSSSVNHLGRQEMLAHHTLDLINQVSSTILWFISNVRTWLLSLPEKIEYSKGLEESGDETVSDTVLPMAEILRWFPVLRAIPEDTVHDFIVGLLKSLNYGENNGGLLSKNGPLSELVKSFTNLTPLLPDVVANKYHFKTLALHIVDFLKELINSVNSFVSKSWRLKSQPSLQSRMFTSRRNKNNEKKVESMLEGAADSIMATVFKKTKELEAEYALSLSHAEKLAEGMSDEDDDEDDSASGSHEQASTSFSGQTLTPRSLRFNSNNNDEDKKTLKEGYCPLINLPVVFPTGTPVCHSDEECTTRQKCCSYIQGVTPRQYCSTMKPSDLAGYVLGGSSYTLSSRTGKHQNTTDFDHIKNPVTFDNETGNIQSGNETINITVVERALHNGILLMINNTDGLEKETWNRLYKLPIADIIQMVVASDKPKGKLDSRRLNVIATKDGSTKKYVDKHGDTYIKIKGDPSIKTKSAHSGGTNKSSSHQKHSPKKVSKTSATHVTETDTTKIKFQSTSPEAAIPLTKTQTGRKKHTRTHTGHKQPGMPPQQPEVGLKTATPKPYPGISSRPGVTYYPGMVPYPGKVSYPGIPSLDSLESQLDAARNWSCPLVNAQIIPTKSRTRCSIDLECGLTSKCCPFVRSVIEAYSVCTEKATGLFGNLLGDLMSPFTSRSYRAGGDSENEDDDDYAIKLVNDSFYAGNTKLDVQSLQQLYSNFVDLMEGNPEQYKLTNDLVKILKGLTMKTILKAQVKNDSSPSSSTPETESFVDSRKKREVFDLRNQIILQNK